ncbi:kinase-like protein [Mytilinidion resinicola]|uniref:Kinase-like protein n=1 Tax=Mytilinidion resinicola TaxID=574789 RepID=A0A6A6Y2X6_9PEZI|nr:kinase-like protein [Mytilinidion resinicola]KAF2803020.1 kinase-like protein [Mytilinidion resinicola]
MIYLELPQNGKSKAKRKPPALISKPKADRSTASDKPVPKLESETIIFENARCKVTKINRDGEVFVVKTCQQPDTIAAAAGEWTIEHRILSELRHPNVIRLLDHNARLLALRLEPLGSDLGKLADESGISTMSPDVQDRVLCGISSVLKFIHRNHATRYGQIHNGGTPYYIPPEVALLKKRGPPGDIWAFGVTMLFVLKVISLPKGRGWLIRDIPKGIGEAAFALTRWTIEMEEAALKLPSGHALVQRMLEPDQQKRITAAEVLAGLTTPAHMELHPPQTN